MDAADKMTGVEGPEGRKMLTKKKRGPGITFSREKKKSSTCFSASYPFFSRSSTVCFPKDERLIGHLFFFSKQSWNNS